MINEILKLFRLQNAIIALIGTFIGYACLQQWRAFDSYLIGGVVFAFCAIAGNIHNDLVDLKADRINRPSRPLVSGKVSLRSAQSFALAFTIAALGLTYFHPIKPFEYTLPVLILLFVYNQFLKATPLWGNLSVALLCAAPVTLAAYQTQLNGALLYTAIFAFAITLAREIVKDIEDFEGDSKAKLKTTAVYFGKAKSRQIALALLYLIVLGLFYSLFTKDLDSFFKITATFLLAPWLLFKTLRWKTRRISEKTFSHSLKQLMIWGMISIFADRFWAG